MKTICENCKTELTEKDIKDMKCNKCNLEMDYDYYLKHYDDLPIEVTDVFDNEDMNDLDYTMLARMVENLEKIGWTMEYYLDAEPFNLHKIEVQPML